MLYRYFPLTLIMFCSIAAWSQNPQSIHLEKGLSVDPSKSLLACPNQFAGTISFANFIGQSNDIDPDTIFLCAGDQIDIVHNGDANMTGDPNPFTTPGITYGYFDCPPTISGPNLASILTDACITNNPPSTEGIWVTQGGSATGNITFNNLGVSQNTFGGGAPVLLWFAPLTIDNFGVKKYETDPATGETGPCVNLNIDQAFAVVYLNEIKASNLEPNAGVSGCQGKFTVKGGLPEFDGSFYDINIELLGNPNVKGWVVNAPVTHNQTVTFQAPVPGIYSVSISDAKNCHINSFLVNMSSCENVTQSVQSGTAAPGDIICLDVVNEAGFNNLVSMQYALTWDTSVVVFDTVLNLTPLLPGFSYNTSFNNLGDTLIFSWGSLSGIGVTLPVGQVLYQVCFEVVGSDGDCTEISFPQGILTDVYNASSTQLGFYGVPGSVCVSASALVVSFTETGVGCPGASDGAFTVTVSGGQAPYSVTWQNLSGGPVGGPATINIDGGSYTVNNADAGIYQVTIVDSQGTPLTSIKQVEVESPPPFNILFNATEPLCNGDLGSIEAEVVFNNAILTDPLQDYTFTWSNIPLNTQLNDSITAGAYTLTLTQIATGCTTSSTINLQQPDPLSVNINVAPATCSGISDGNLTVTVYGGTPNNNGDYVIQWPTIGGGGGLTIVNTVSNISGLESGSYQLIATDNNGCFIQQNIWLAADKVLSADALITNSGCSIGCTGSIFVTGNTTGAAPSLPYLFNWFGNPVPPAPSEVTATTSLLAGLCTGSYTLKMEDAAGCKIDTTFEIITPPPFTITANVQNESCSPGNDGTIVVSVSGGSYPYTYNWNIPAADSVVTGLSAGAYSVTVEDAGGCSDTLSVTITAPLGPTISSLSDDQVSCTDSQDGSLSVTAIAGSSPIVSYLWSTGGEEDFISGLTPGQYSVTVTDAGGCTAEGAASVTAPPPLSLDNVDNISPQCPGLGGGSVAITVSGGTGPYLFEWSNGLSGTGFNVNGNIPAGDYSVSVTDANGCPPLIANITLEDPPSIVAIFSNIDSVSCANTGTTCDGSATATGAYSDGTTGTFFFTWGSGEFANDAIFSAANQLCAGSQNLTISDGFCFIDTTVFIPSPLPISSNPMIGNVTCYGFSDGTVTLLPVGGTAPYSILWQNGISGPTLTGLAAGDYTAIITDSKNCTFTHKVTITEPGPLTVSLNPTQTSDVSCAGDEDGIITVIAQGGNIGLGNVSYLWENGVAPGSSSTAFNLAPGTYSVTVVDAKGCSASLTHSISQPSPILFQIGQIQPILCNGNNTFVTVDSIWGGLPTAIYQFSVDGGINRLPGDPSPIFSGDHTITVVDVINGCETETTINVAEPPLLQVELPNIVEIELGDSLTTLNPKIISSLPIDTFFWSPADYLSCTNCKNPKVTAVIDKLYTLTVVDLNGCSASAQVFVDIDKNRNVYIPNIFSPNGDGINDYFQVYAGIGVSRINFVRVYDRWGEMMFEETDLLPGPDGTPGWDGNFRGKKMNPATFLYLIEVEFLDGRVLLYRGDVSIIK